MEFTLIISISINAALLLAIRNYANLLSIAEATAVMWSRREGDAWRETRRLKNELNRMAEEKISAEQDREKLIAIERILSGKTPDPFEGML